MKAAPSHRGRSVGAWYKPEELAELLDVPVAVVLRALRHERARLSFFPGAIQMGANADNWHVPEKDLKRTLFGGARVEHLMSVATFAGVIDRTPNTVRDWLQTGRLRSYDIMGQHGIPESEYWRLRGEAPPRRARFSFFSGQGNDSKEDAR